ncbi:MAG TPA: DUF885 domain-containing protein, partial [Hellea balneolensis]|nr:DUF885 domain-containing protein [Hellea balneolensis]
RLDKQGQISYRLYEYDGNIAKALHPYAYDDYVFNLMEGAHSDFPTFMVNFHKVKTPKDARNYIARLNAAKTYLGQNRERAQAQFEKGVFLPKFTYDRMINAAQNVITGAPFDTGKDSPLYADIKAKIDALDIDDDTKSALLEDARQAVLNSIGPAYRDIITMFETHKKTATDEDGAWKLPNGDAYYQSRLKYYTTTNLTAEQIHQIGLKEVARIQAEMHKIMDQVGFKGSLQDFYAFLRTDPQFTYPNTDEGRAQYMQEATQIIADMRARLNDLFITKPKADIIVKRVEPFREATAFGAFYDQPSLDGSRPGTYFINLRNMKDQPIYLMQALAYHEGIPGHHMQIAIAQELTGIPEFRKQGGYTSYVEGWALYAESVPAELGLYTDPYKDFGRLSMEIFRAARLVVDTGIHSQKWTREQAVQYMLKNIANPEGDIRAEIDRYIVWPGQATAYKIGMLKIIELRENAKKKLGDKFDIREFHDIVLTSGPVPLAILEEMVDEWVKSKG